MSAPDDPYDPEVYELLEWFEVNGGVANRDDIPERLRPWRAVLKRDGLLTNTGTMWNVPDLSDSGKIVLLKYRRQPVAATSVAPPVTLQAGGLLPFDLPAIFRCAVELGAAVNDQADGAESREADIAGERLLQVLNPRRANFPSGLEWDYYRFISAVREDWPNDAEHRPGWKQELDVADASPAARQALLTLGLALADLRGDRQWHDRGRELLSAGTWNLWDGMGPSHRNTVRHLLPETHRLWGWPADPAGEPGPFAGPVATLSDPRVITGWRTVTPEALDAVQQTILAGNYLVDGVLLANGRRLPMYRHDVRPSTAALPSICPKADPKPPVELRADGDMLAEIEARYRSLRLIGDDQSLHWVGRQTSPESTCTCDLTAPGSTPRPVDRQSLRQLRRAIFALVAFVQARYERRLGPEELQQLDRLGERVNGLTGDLRMELPTFPVPSGDEALCPYGPASVPMRVTEDGYVPSPDAGRLWESEWRAVRVAVETHLAALDPCPLPCQAPTVLQVDTREVPMEAPAGTPSPLREAFDGVAEALFQAAEMRRCPPTGRPLFEEEARRLSVAFNAGRERYAAAELLLQAVSDDNGRCAHQEALNVVCRINDACGHVMLRIMPFHRATAHILAVPAFDLAVLLGAMRRQTSRATVQLQAAGARLVQVGDRRESERVERLSAEGQPSRQSAAELPTATNSGSTALPDGPFGTDGFRYQNVVVRFGRAAKQRSLVLALWDGANHRPRGARPIEDVLTEVYGESMTLRMLPFANCARTPAVGLKVLLCL